MSKYNAKKVEYKGIVFDSKVECEYYQYLESNMNALTMIVSKYNRNLNYNLNSGNKDRLRI